MKFKTTLKGKAITWITNNKSKINLSYQMLSRFYGSFPINNVVISFTGSQFN